MAQKRRRTIPMARTVGVSVDVVSDAAIRKLMEVEGLTYSGALCSLVTTSAMADPRLLGAIKRVLAEVVEERLQSQGWHPNLSAMLSREITTGVSEVPSWS